MLLGLLIQLLLSSPLLNALRHPRHPVLQQHAVLGLLSPSPAQGTLRKPQLSSALAPGAADHRSRDETRARTEKSSPHFQ